LAAAARAVLYFGVVGQKQRYLASANLGLAILAFINLFSYLDRYVLSGVLEDIKHDLNFSDTQLGSLGFGFLLVYALLAPVFGALGDRRSRPRLIALGVALWSFATAMSGFALNFLSLFAARAAVGVGEASYVTIAPSLLSDYFPLRQRGRVMAIFFCAIPVGSALGYVVGGFVSTHWSWRAAFFVAGVPGLALAALCLLLRDPPRGIQDRAIAPRQAPSQAPLEAPRSSLGRDVWLTYKRLLRNKPYVLTVLGYAAYTFALGGLAFWMPAFLERVRGTPRIKATVDFGTIVVVTGFVGTFIGGWLGDHFAKHARHAYLWLSAIATLVAAPFVWMALTTTSNSVYVVSMVTAQLLLFLSTGPINAAIVNLVDAGERATAIALSVLAIHLLGDVISPLMVGALSDLSSLQQGIKILPLAVVIGGLVWAWAARAQGASDPMPLVPQAQR
jgi:MFS transporter, Spinster family, sphingosine-1-phosphate transporter